MNFELFKQDVIMTQIISIIQLLNDMLYEITLLIY